MKPLSGSQQPTRARRLQPRERPAQERLRADLLGLGMGAFRSLLSIGAPAERRHEAGNTADSGGGSWVKTGNQPARGTVSEAGSLRASSLHQSEDPGVAAGSMFRLTRKKLSGSYFALISASRWKFPLYDSWARSVPSSSV